MQHQASTEDRRRIELSLSEAGRTLGERVLSPVWELVEAPWSNFSPGEIVEFDRLLRKLSAALGMPGKAP